MYKETIFAKMNREYYDLTTSEKKLAAYVLQEKSKVPHLSITELAEDCGVAESTITRFCQRLGCKGFSTFKLAVSSGNAPQETTEDSPSGAISQDDSVKTIKEKVKNNNYASIQNTAELVEEENVFLACDLLTSAKRVLTMGQGNSMIVAQAVSQFFQDVLPYVYAIWDSHLQESALQSLEPGDVLLYFSYSGGHQNAIDLLSQGKKRGVKIILITRFPNCPAVTYAHVTLQCGTKESPIQSSSFGAKMAQLYLMEVIYCELCRRAMTATPSPQEEPNRIPGKK